MLLEPGHSKAIDFKIDGEGLSHVDNTGARVIDPGGFKFTLAESAQETKLIGNLRVATKVVVKSAPKFVQQRLVAPRDVQSNVAFKVSSELKNTGEVPGDKALSLLVDDKRVDGTNLRLQSGASQDVVFKPQIFRPGRHMLQLGDQKTPIQVAARRATLSYSDIKASDDIIFAGQNMTVSATVTNLGSVDGVANAALKVNGTVVASRQVNVPAAAGGASSTFEISHRFFQSGTYKLAINDSSPFTVDVLDRIKAPLMGFTAAGAAAQIGQSSDGSYTIAVKSSYAFDTSGGKKDSYAAIAQRNVGGDFTSVVKVDSQDATQGYAMAALMVRNDISQPGKSKGYAAMCITPTGGYFFLSDCNDDGYLNRASEYGYETKTKYPVWLKLEKHGTIISGFASNDGNTWKLVAATKMPSAHPEQQVGMFATSNNLNARGMVRFSTFKINPRSSNLASAPDFRLTNSLKAPAGAYQNSGQMLLGSLNKPSNFAVKLARLPQVVVTASSFYTFGFPSAPACAVWNPNGAWCSRSEGPRAWLTIDFGKRVRITGIAYQSRSDLTDWVNSFTLTSDNGTVQKMKIIHKNIKSMQYFDIKDVTTRYLRWDALDASHYNTGGKIMVFGTLVDQH